MATTNLKLTATADTSDAKRKIDDLKKQTIDVQDEIAQKNRERLKEAIGLIAPVSVAVQALMRVVDGAIGKVQEFIGRVASYRDTYAKSGEDLDTLAKNLNATTAETIRLQAAADAAGIGAKDYAAALDKIKASIAQSRSRLFASYLANAGKQREIEIGAAEDVSAQLGGLGVHGEIAQSFLDEVLAGRTAQITNREYIRRATDRGIGLQTLGIDAETIPIAIRALNDMIREQETARQAARAKAEQEDRDRADQTFRMIERFMAANGNNFEAALNSAAGVLGIDLEEARRRYDQGFGQLPAEEVEMRRIKEEEAKRREEAEREKRYAENPALRAYERYGILPEAGTNAGKKGGTANAAVAALKWAFSEGGGLLSGVNYGFGVFQNDPAAKIVSAISDGIKATIRELKGISKELKD